MKFIKNWSEVIVAVTFLTGIGASWIFTNSAGSTEVAVTATAYEPPAVDSDRSLASDGAEAAESGDEVEDTEKTQN